MSTIIGIVIGLVTGLTASVAFWWWQTKLLQPKIMICPTLAKYRTPGGEDRCEIKLINRGRRAAADLSITLQIAVPGLTSPGANQILDLRSAHLPWLREKEDWYYHIDPSQLSDSDRRGYGPYFPEKVARSFRTASKISMWDFVDLCEGSSIKAYIIASDAFSGARGFTTQTFGIADFREGPFLEGDSFNHTGKRESQRSSDENSVH